MHSCFAVHWHILDMTGGGIRLPLRILGQGKKLTNSVFDIGGGRPKIYFVPLNRRLLGAFYYEGKEYDFNFSKLHLHVKTEFSFEEKEDEVVWHVRQENIHAVMETEVHCLIFLPFTLIVMVFGGLLHIAFPLLIVAMLASLVTKEA